MVSELYYLYMKNVSTYQMSYEFAKNELYISFENVIILNDLFKLAAFEYLESNFSIFLAYNDLVWTEIISFNKLVNFFSLYGGSKKIISNFLFIFKNKSLLYISFSIIS